MNLAFRMDETMEAENTTTKEAIRALAIEAGFIRCRFLAPYTPFPNGAHDKRFLGAPSLMVTALVHGWDEGGGDDGGDEGLCGIGINMKKNAKIAPFARFNYYREAVKRLQALALILRERFGGERRDFSILCNSPIPEKPLAAACGLGVIGKNGLVITREAGSRVVLAAMTLPYTMAGDGGYSDGGDADDFRPCDACFRHGDACFRHGDACFRQSDTCLSAKRPDALPPCARACPTAALPGDGSLVRERCIQWYASGQGDAGVPEPVKKAWGRRFYGCTACQDACPHNRSVAPRHGGAVSSGLSRQTVTPAVTREGPLPAWLDTREILAASDAELKQRFKGTALGLSWLTPDVLRRNAQLGGAGSAGGQLSQGW
jgi:epoxyqueuosine reductase